ncbi:hypothetical protein [Streptomyces sp. NPDC001658]
MGSLLWRPLHERDPAHIWLRKIAAEAGHLVAASTAETDHRDLSRRRSAGNRDLVERFIHWTKSI